MDRIVLGYSGGLGATIAIHRLREQAGVEIIAVAMDVGQGENLEEVRARALASGAKRAHVLDVREDLARDWIVPVLRAGAILAAPRPLALVRPLVARKLVEIAEIEQAAAVADGRLDGANVPLLEGAAAQRGATLRVLAPARDTGWSAVEARAFAAANHLRFSESGGPGARVEVSLWGRLAARPAAAAAEPAASGPPPDGRPAEPALIDLAFERGAPTAINGVNMPPLELLASLGTIAAAHGIGRIDVPPDPAAPSAPLACEAPALVVLDGAHHALQALVMAPPLARFAESVTAAYAGIVRQGEFFTPFRDALDAFVDRAQERVSGSVRIKLAGGAFAVVARSSPFAVYDHQLGEPVTTA